MFSLALQQKHQALASCALLRVQEAVESAPSVNVSVGNKRYLSFSSNNYLGLAHHPNVIAACQVAAKKYGVGSGSAYLIAGYTSAHRQLEEKLAEYLNYPRVLLFSSGYLANIGTISALFSSNDVIFCDKLNHASLIDGCLASRATFKRYPHRNMRTLNHLCTTTTGRNKLIVTEGLFGMEGLLAPLNVISDIAATHNAILLVDDAHGIGVMGASGRGALECHQLTASQVTILTGTLGKAFGSYGAFVASSDLIIDSLIQRARTYIYTTAIPPAIAAASLASLQLLQEESWRRQQLVELIHYFRQGVQQLTLPFLPSDSPIQPIVLGGSERALAIAQYLLSKGLFIKPIRPPTVPSSAARLRITITAEHTKSQLDRLLEALDHAIKQY